MDHQPGVIGDEVDESLRHLGEFGFVGQEFVAQAMHLEGALGHAAFGVDVDVEGLAGGQVVEQLQRADLDDAVAVFGVETGGFRIQDDLTHGK